LSPLFDASLASWHYIPFAVSLLLFGLPHGAVDHLVIADLTGRKLLSWKPLALVFGYLILAVAVFAAWFAAPVAMFVGFIAITWFHWGQGDAWSLFEELNGQPRSPLLRGLGLFVRGALPMLLPFLAFPEVYLGVADDLAALFGHDGATTLAALASWEFRGGLGAGYLAVALGYLILARRRAASTRAWLVDAAEIALLTAFFLLVPPILSVGLYFSLWHAPRHMIRLSRALPGAERSRTDWQDFGGVMIASVPLTAVSLAALAAIGWWLGFSPDTPGRNLAIYLALIAAVTVPHVIVVTWMDARGGLWSTS
jgi:Brp/Blh family beta-carotene 15,15'-monooxygenase